MNIWLFVAAVLTFLLGATHSLLGQHLIMRPLLGLELPQISRQLPDDAALGMVRMAFDHCADVGNGGAAAQHPFGYKPFCKPANACWLYLFGFWLALPPGHRSDA